MGSGLRAGEAGRRASQARPTRGLWLCGARLGLLRTRLCPGSEGGRRWQGWSPSWQ